LSAGSAKKARLSHSNQPITTHAARAAEIQEIVGKLGADLEQFYENHTEKTLDAFKGLTEYSKTVLQLHNDIEPIAKEVAAEEKRLRSKGCVIM